MPNGLTKISNTTRIMRRAARKLVSRPDEAWLLIRMAWWVTVLSAAARCYSLPRALKLVAGTTNSELPARDEAEQERLARAIDLLLSADILMFKPICWKRAAVLHRYLSRNGVETKIVFGVRNETNGKVAGHAWLEHDGRPILESAPPEYSVTYSFP